VFSRPRVKPEHRPYRLASGAIRIGGLIYGVAAEIEDPDGTVWTLLQGMDGSRTLDDLVELVCAGHPGEYADTARQAVVDLCESGHIEDAVQHEPVRLTARERERYSRNQSFYRWIDLTPRTDQWHAQHRLRNAAIVVVGLGGMGGVAATALAAAGVGQLHCVDTDTVELSNLNRQVLYTEDDLGHPKVDVAVARLNRLNSDITVTGEHRRISATRDLIDFAARCDLLVLGADSPHDISDWANEACLTAGRPWIDGGYSGPHVTVATYRPGQGACYQCVVTTDRSNSPQPAGPDLDINTLTVGNAVTAATAGVCGNLVAHLAMSIITGVPQISPGTVYGIDLGSMQNQFLLNYDRRADCPACSAR